MLLVFSLWDGSSGSSMVTPRKNEKNSLFLRYSLQVHCLVMSLSSLSVRNTSSLRRAAASQWLGLCPVLQKHLLVFPSYLRPSVAHLSSGSRCLRPFSSPHASISVVLEAFSARPSCNRCSLVASQRLAGFAHTLERGVELRDDSSLWSPCGWDRVYLPRCGILGLCTKLALHQRFLDE